MRRGGAAGGAAPLARGNSMRGVPALRAEVLVIGGGATGAGVAWDAALRGFDVVLVERGDLAEGTSGRFHGLLHSGGRYVVKDPVAAEECVVENAILRAGRSRTASRTPAGCSSRRPTTTPPTATGSSRAAARPSCRRRRSTSPRRCGASRGCNPGIRRAFAVPDASIDAWKTVWSFARGAAAHGARILTYHRVIDLHRCGRRGHRRARCATS